MSEGMPMTKWHQMVCSACEKAGHAYAMETLARIDRDTHNRSEHNGQQVAELRSFDADAIGVKPKRSQTPPYPPEDADTDEVEA